LYGSRALNPQQNKVVSIETPSNADNKERAGKTQADETKF
jgi:hypothetical protein